MNDEQAHDILLQISDQMAELITLLPGDQKFNNRVYGEAFNDVWEVQVLKCRDDLKSAIYLMRHCLAEDKKPVE